MTTQTIFCGEFRGRPIHLALPQSASCEPSKFGFSFWKAGSTLLFDILRGMSHASGMAYYSLMDEMWAAGIPLGHIPPSASAAFVPHGYVYGGFRAIPPRISIPHWARGNSVLLVRDPRDILVSLYFSEAFSHAVPPAGADRRAVRKFHARRSRARSMPIDAYVLQRAIPVARHFTRLINMCEGVGDITIYRYEDVIFEKQSWVRDMTGRLGMPIAPEQIATIAERVDVRPKGEDPGKHVRKVLPGDHREKLRNATIGELDQVLGNILMRYGYG